MPITRESFNGQPEPATEPDLVEQYADPGLLGPPLPSDVRRAIREQRLYRIQAKADRYQPKRAALLLAASLLFGVFWAAGWACKRLFKAAAWTVAAAQVGWQDGMGLGPTKAEVAEENRLLREEVMRLGGAPPDTPRAADMRKIRAQVAR